MIVTSRSSFAPTIPIMLHCLQLEQVHALIAIEASVAAADAELRRDDLVDFRLDCALDGRQSDGSLALNFIVRVDHAVDQTNLHSLLKRLLVHLLECLTGRSVTQNAFLVDDALGPVYVALISVEPVNTGLQSLLNDVLLHDEVATAPILAQIRQQLVLAEVDTCSRVSRVLFNDLHQVLRRNNAIRLCFVPSSFVGGLRRCRIHMHMFVDE